MFKNSVAQIPQTNKNIIETQSNELNKNNTKKYGQADCCHSCYYCRITLIYIPAL